MHMRSCARLVAPLAVAALLALPLSCPAQSYSGSAFEVSDEGHLLTNHHVVERCKAIRVRKGQLEDEATLIASDAREDLALLHDFKLAVDRINYRRLIGGDSKPYARFPDDQQHFLYGETIVVAGYPLPDFIGGINVTTGTVSAMSGPNNDANLFQVTAPIQGGNSGGPVLNSRGTVVGVVVATLDPIKMQKFAGVLPQNVNFAIQGKVAREFVRKSIGKVAVDDVAARELATTAVATYATQITFQVLCLN